MKIQANIVISVVLAVAPFGDAANTFLPQKHASLVGEASTHNTKEMPVTEHKKTAGEGYAKGSPLFKKQEARKKDGKTAPPPPPPGAVPGASVPVVPVGGAVPGISAPVAAEVQLQAYVLSWKGFTFMLSYVITAFLIALMWKHCGGWRNLKGWKERGNLPNGFSYGLFSTDHCCSGGDHHVHICLCSWCCQPLRIADTWSKNPQPIVKNFWVALLIVAALMGLAPWTNNISVLVLILVAVYCRNKMRKDYGIENSTCTTLTEDCLTWWCCTFCAIAQEARQSEFCVKTMDPDPDKGY
jgi:Cys-rich protein (TIGR01571 family)